MLASGFSVIGERPGEELVLGTVGRFCRARGELCATSPARFREAAPPGTAKVAWNFIVGRCSDGTTELRTETRVLCADVAARRSFRAYWLLIKPFSGLIRRDVWLPFEARQTQAKITSWPCRIRRESDESASCMSGLTRESKLFQLRLAVKYFAFPCKPFLAEWI
jgi:hypothetical protein